LSAAEIAKVKSMKPLARAPLLHVSVQESLRGFIDENELGPGSALPPESFLAQQLGVSRNSMREAIKALESVGILETRRGIGVFVRAFSFAPLLDNLAYGLGGALREVEEVLEIRRVLEVGLIGKTIELIGEDDIAELKDVVEQMRLSAERNEGFAEADQRFHNLLFRCQENKMLTGLIDVFWLAFYKASDIINLTSKDPMATWQDHYDIYAAVAARDTAAARSRLDQHYDGIARLIATGKATKTPG
jgi:DNA-binding FadR family transcriptional regulator